MGFSKAAGRTIKFGERKSSEQLVTACLLLLGDGDAGPIGFLGVGQIRRIEFQQDVAAQPMEVWDPARLSVLFRDRQSLVDPCQRALRTQRRGLKLGDQPAKPWGTCSIALGQLCGQYPTQLTGTCLGIHDPAKRPIEEYLAQVGESPDP